MTNEEKAEENYTKIYLNGDMSLDTEEKYFAYTKGYCKGHTDGLAEGKPKWHDLRKNPNDLPKKTGHYLTDDGEYVYHVECRKWRTLTCMVCWDFNWLDDGDVIAWCELPKFEE